MDTQEEDWKHVGFALVVAMDENGGIGFQGGLPWPWLEEDMRRFRMLTEGSVVVMGRKTYLSIPKRNRPLKNRLNVVLTRSGDHPAMRDELGGGEGGELVLAESLAKVEEIVERNGERKKVFVIGGGEIFKMALENPKWSTRVYLTTVHEKFESDVFFPKDCLRNEFDESMLSNRMREKDLEFSFSELRRRSSPMSPNHGESQYLNLIKEIIEHGNRKGDRTGTGTRSIFGAQMRFDLRESFPILTTRRVFWRGVVEELLWFIKGSTNAQDLRDKDIHIWDGNGSRSFLDAMGFTEREEWDLGPVYGFQWRHFGAEYHGMHADYSGQVRCLSFDHPRRRSLSNCFVGSRSASAGYRYNQDESQRPQNNIDGLESKRLAKDGTTALSFNVSVLCQRRRALLPNVPAFVRYGARSPLQHCLLFTSYLHGCQGVWASAWRFCSYSWRRSRI
uniref:DHFR domain-containing protein n=1 Tax=Compsopogon caeruleus TaxID=31354 RepID=A0A7S1TFJ1_9RHOD|mmetsp:Transcript_3774/g.7209  ORF Transcript_3774/g.7209 Transcript_3774/m.7209 type:complete len:448 (+) Transcript_3774:96-1439(+)